MIKVPVNTVKDQDVEKIDYIKELNEELKQLSSISELYICKSYRDEFDPKILEDVKIPIHDSGQECGKVDIGEWISQYLADIEHEGKPQRVFSRRNNPFRRPEFLPIGMTKESGPTDRVEVKLTEEQYKKITDFEKKHITSSGPSSSYIGELFRAMQYIEYRAGNDGDCYYTIGTPSFISHLYVMSTLDYINWSWLYDKELELSTPLLNSWIWDNKIHWDGMLFEFEMIKIILIELLENGTITDRENNTDSRDFTQIKKESHWILINTLKMDYGKKYFTTTNKHGMSVVQTMRMVNQPEILNFITHNPGRTERQIMQELYNYPNPNAVFQDSNKKYADRLRSLLYGKKISRVKAKTADGPRFIYYVSNEK